MVNLNQELVKAEAALSRRTALKMSAWSVPVIALAIAAPAAAASMDPKPTPVTCTKLPNHGGGGDTGNKWYVVGYMVLLTVRLSYGSCVDDEHHTRF